VGRPAIELDGLTKFYGPVVGLDGVSLNVEPGEVFGFLGANGAGKTTTIRMLLDLVRPSAGRAAVLGFDCQRQSFEARRRIGYLPGEMPMYPELSGAAYLRFLSALGDRPPSESRLDVLFRRFDVSERDLTRRMRDYSHGMKRKMGLIQALMTEAPVLVLDEPTSGLDPMTIEAFGETIHDLAREGRATVFLSSHVLSEVDRLCSRIALIRRGRLIGVHLLDDLRRCRPRRVTIQFSSPVAEVALPPNVLTVTQAPERVVLDVDGPLGPLLSALAALPVADLSERTPGLEEIVLEMFARASEC